MSDQRVIRFSYQQSLSWEEGPGTRWSEYVQASVTVLDYALSSGWLRDHFSGRRGGSNDFLVLLAIVMHARPLEDPDLTYLVNLNMARPEDQGRLYARVTDIGLSEELGMHRTTVAMSTQRLSEMSFISITEIPETLAHFRDSRGRFEGTKIYLLAGDIQDRFMPKDLVIPAQEGGNTKRISRVTHHDGLTDTEKNDAMLSRDTRVGSTDMEALKNRPAVSAQLTDTAGSPDTNKEGEEEEEVLRTSANNEKIESNKIFNRFAKLRETEYRATRRDQAALEALIRDGYSESEILAGIERAAAHLEGSLRIARSFTYCIPEIRRFHPGVSVLDNFAQPIGTTSDGPTIKNTNDSLGAGSVPETVLTVFAQAASRVPSQAERNRLIWLFEEFSPIANAQNENGWDWIIDALKKSPPEIRSPVAYVRTLLSRRVQHRRKARKTGDQIHQEHGQGTESKIQAAPTETSLSIGAETSTSPDYPITVGGLPIEKPKPRKSGYVLPGELAMGYLYDFAKKHIEPLSEIQDDDDQ